MGQWAVRHQGATPLELFPPTVVHRRLPRTVEPEILSEYRGRLETRLYGRYLVPVHQARILGQEGLLVLPDGSYSAEEILGEANLVRRTDYFAPRRRPTVPKSGDYFELLDFITPGHYYHWLHDTLSRVYGVREHLPPGTRFIVSPHLTPLQQETLRLVGIGESDLVHFDPAQVWQLETLHFAPPPTWSGAHRREIDHWLRDTILDGYGLAPEPGGRRIYISRNDMPNRRLVNESEVLEVLRPHGFDVCAPERLDLRAQAELFSGAEVIVSTHGSALTNILFAPPGLRIVDMVPPSMFTNAFAFWAMAEELGHEYWYFTVADVEVPGARQPDVRVPVETLVETLQRMAL